MSSRCFLVYDEGEAREESIINHTVFMKDSGEVYFPESISYKRRIEWQNGLSPPREQILKRQLNNFTYRLLQPE